MTALILVFSVITPLSSFIASATVCLANNWGLWYSEPRSLIAQNNGTDSNPH